MEIVEKVLESCTRSGAEAAEVYNLSRKSLTINVRNGEVETVTKATPGGLAIRYSKGGKSSFGHTSDIADHIVDKLIPKLSRSAEVGGDKTPIIFPERQIDSADLQIYDETQAEASMDAKIEYLTNLEKIAMKFDPLIQRSNGVWYREIVTTKSIANTKGIMLKYSSTNYEAGISVVAIKGNEMFPGEGDVGARSFADLPSPETIVEYFAGKAVRLIGGTPVSGGDYEIIFTPGGSWSLLWGFLFGLDGDEAHKGASFLSNKVGQKVASEGFSVVDDATMPKGVGSRPADDEGVASQRNLLIENGVLKGYLYDLKAAAKAGAKSTGSASREDYNSFPGIWATNLYIEPGKNKFEDVVASCKKGIIVEQTAGWGLHSVTGQYSAGINGILVENGKRIRPVAGVTVAGSSDELLNSIGAICDDIQYYWSMTAPSIMVKKMRVGG